MEYAWNMLENISMEYCGICVEYTRICLDFV
jgi:hypothetical protein